MVNNTGEILRRLLRPAPSTYHEDQLHGLESDGLLVDTEALLMPPWVGWRET